MVGLIVLGIAFLFFIMVAYFAAKTWHVGHVVALVFLFLSTLCLLFLTATLFKTYETFRPEYQDKLAALERAQQEARVLQFGEPGTQAGETSLVGAQGLARSALLGRGRVWRNLRFVQGPANAITLSTANWRNDGCAIVGQDPADEEVPEPIPDEELLGEEAGAGDGAEGPAVLGNPHGITENQFVHSFLEIPIAQHLTRAEKEDYFGKLEGEENFADRDRRGDCRVPLAYLGRYRVVATTGQTVSLVSDGPLDRAQQKMIGDQKTWVLYEQLPLDSHEMFAEVPLEELRGLIPLDRLHRWGINILPAHHQAMLEDYLRDGKPANERSDRPERMVLTVEFVREHEVVVDLQVEGELPPADQPYDTLGRAQVRHLMQHDAEGNSMPTTKFSPGQMATFDYETGMGLVQQGVAKRDVEGVRYVRQLRAYEYDFDSFHSRSAKLRDQIAVAQTDLNALTNSTNTLRDRILKYETEEKLLAADLDGFTLEQRQLRQYMGQLRHRFDALKREINRLYLSQRRAFATPLAFAQ